MTDDKERKRVSQQRPLQWKFEGGCIRCTSHALRQGYPVMQRFGVFRPVARFFLLKRFGKTLPSSVVMRHTCDHRWCINPSHVISGSRFDNNRDRSERGRTARILGEENANAVLTNEQVRKIRESSLSQRKTAKLFGVSQKLVWNIKHGLTWSHV